MKYSKEKKSNLQKIFNIVLLVFSIGILMYFCIANNNLVTLINALPALNIFWLLSALLSMILFWIVDSTILFEIASSVCDKGYKRKNALKVTMVGQYFNAISPFAILGQPMQIVTMLRQGISTGLAFSILIQKFLIYQTTLTAYSLLVIILKYSFFREQFAAFMSLALIGFLTQSFIVVLLVLFSVNRKFTTRIIKFCFNLLSKLHIVKNPEKISKSLETQLQFYLNNNREMNKNYKFTVKIYLLTFIQLTSLFIIPFYIFKAYHNPGVPIIDMVSAQAFVTMISSCTPLPGGSGASEGSFLIIFNLFFGSATTNQAMLLWRFITYYSCIVFGAFFALSDNRKEKLSVDVSKIITQNVQENNDIKL